MCGIPMLPPPDATRGARLTFEQAVAHIGGADNLISAHGRELIDQNRKDYMWKYPGHAYCTYCGEDVGDLKARHNAEVGCPKCHRAVTFRHESRGHKKIFDQFCLYEWRKSIIDPETIVLTAAHVWRDSTRDHPEASPLCVHASAIYVFRPGRAVTVYKHHRWHTNDPHYWGRVDNVAPDHTGYSGGLMETVMDYGEFERAIEGTRIGRVYEMLDDARHRDALELIPIANCARKPYLEYLAKAGQRALAEELMRMNAAPANVICAPRARNPRQLLGLTEAQWHETRRDGLSLTCHILRCLYYLRAMGLGDMHMDQVLEIAARGKDMAAYWLSKIAPSKDRRGTCGIPTLGDTLIAEGVPEKLRRKIFRRAVRELDDAMEWRDYYLQLHRLGEDFSDTALILPRDVRAMHQRMIERENALKAEARVRDAEACSGVFRAKRLPKLQRRYTWHAHGLLLRPYESAREIVDEGRALHICIGSYAKRYMQGDTIICALRREEEPDVPWRAVEFSAFNGRVVQDRGAHNDADGIEPGVRKILKLFWKDFERRTA